MRSRLLAHSKERAGSEEKMNADRLAAFSDASQWEKLGPSSRMTASGAPVGWPAIQELSGNRNCHRPITLHRVGGQRCWHMPGLRQLARARPPVSAATRWSWCPYPHALALTSLFIRSMRDVPNCRLENVVRVIGPFEMEHALIVESEGQRNALLLGHIKQVDVACRQGIRRKGV